MSATPSPGLAAPHVLIVEDHEDSRDMLRQVLEYSGLRVSGAASVEQALSRTKSTKFDVVITDVSLSGGERDGVWLLKRVQQTTPQLPVIAITGHKEREPELLELGFAVVLLKPLDALSLPVVVRNIAGR